MQDLPDRLQSAVAGRYTIERELGRGGMAVVFRARDHKHDRIVAIKVLRPEIAASLGGQRFLREIQIAASLQHPHILPLYDSGEGNGVLYYVMPFVEGETLRQRLTRETQLPLEDAIRIAGDVANALSYAHSYGVMHRDIKPENILLSGAHAMVSDFGVARAVTAAGAESLTDSGVAVGTPAYMSPEQGTAGPEADARSDIYSLGCVLYEMIAGEPPFTGPTAQTIIARHVSESLPSLRVVRPSVPAAIQAVVEKALAKVPADRYPTASAFTEAIEAAAAAGTAVERVGRGGRIGWRRGVIAALAFIGGLGLLRALSVTPHGAPPAGEALDQRRIAVLYLSDRSPNEDLGYLAESITEDLIDILSRVDRLRVIPPSGVREYRGREVALREVVQRLRVGSLIDGSVTGSGDRVRVTVRLSDTEEQRQLDSKTVEAPVGDLLAVRDAVADSVSRFLRERLGAEIEAIDRRAGTDDPRAWELVQRAEGERKTSQELRTAGDVSGAQAALGRADSLAALAEVADPSWIEPVVLRGWGALERARLWATEGAEAGTPDSVPVFAAFQQALRHAGRALALDASDAYALELRGIARYRMWDPPVPAIAANRAALVRDAEADLRAARATHPWPARVLSTLSDLTRRRGDFEEARLLAQEAVEADEFLIEARNVTFQLAQAYMDVGRHGEAADICDEGLGRFAADVRFPLCALTALASGGGRSAPARAWKLAGEMVRRSLPDARMLYRTTGRMLVAMVLAQAGLEDSARSVIEEARYAAPEDDPRAGLLAYNEAAAWAAVGDEDRAVEALQRYLDLFPQRRTYVAADAWFRSLHGDPRFSQLVRPAR